MCVKAFGTYRAIESQNVNLQGLIELHDKPIGYRLQIITAVLFNKLSAI
jgi:hypothetical protein